MIKILNEEVVTYNPEEVVKLAEALLTRMNNEHIRHSNQIGKLFNQYGKELDRLSAEIDKEAQLYYKNLEQIRRDEEEQLTGPFSIHLTYPS